MITIGDDLLRQTSPEFGPEIDALIACNANPVGVAPDSNKVAQGFEHADLFTVVFEHFQTDTADYPDILLPATTQLEHVDVHSSYAHYYMMANNAVIAPLGETKSNTEFFRLLVKKMGFTDPCLCETDEQMAAKAFRTDDAKQSILIGSLSRVVVGKS